MERADLELIEKMLERDGCNCDESTPDVLCVNHHIQAAIDELRSLRARTVSCEACNGMAKERDALREECRATVEEINSCRTSGDAIAIYVDALHTYGPDGVDWHAINSAILKRWKPSTLERIKRDAWKRVRKCNENGGLGA